MDYFLYERDHGHERIKVRWGNSFFLFSVFSRAIFVFLCIFRWYKMGLSARNGLTRPCTIYLFNGTKIKPKVHFTIKNIFYDKIDSELFYFHVTIFSSLH